MNTLHLNDDEPTKNDRAADSADRQLWPDGSPFSEPLSRDPDPYDDVGTDYVPGRPFIPEPYEPEPLAETVRKGGLAWSAGIAFFGSVVFMLFLGWLVDLLLGSSPWGLVGGMIFGSLIGFVQFFRITSRIFPPKPDVKARPLFSEASNDEADGPPQF